MARSDAGPLLRFIRAFRVPGAGPEDAALLERYVGQGDEAAFELLLWRHAGMVLRVCQEVLQDAFEAEDAFQATFCVLARKARGIGKREALAGWLYRVALRIALKARKKRARRCLHEAAAADRAAESHDASETLMADWRPILHEEVGKLPEKYRLPMVLCYLEGRTQQQAALELSWPTGTVAGRLARARELLRKRLTRRGLVLSAGLALFTCASPLAAAVPAALAKSTARTALAFAAGKITGLSPQIALWAEGAVRTMMWLKLKAVVLVLGALTVVGGGTGAVIYAVNGNGGSGADNAGAQQQAGNQPAEAPKSKRRSREILVVSRQEGVVEVVGRELKPGEKLPADEITEVRSGKQTWRFKTLREGDQVKAGQLLFKLDDRLARNRLKIAQAKLTVAQTEYEGAYRTFLEADQRHRTAMKLYERRPPLIGEEEYREKKLARDKFLAEAEGKKAQITVAEGDVANAELLVEMHEVRSPVNGAVTAILRRPGEGVRALDPVIEILPQQKKQ